MRQGVVLHEIVKRLVRAVGHTHGVGASTDAGHDDLLVAAPVAFSSFASPSSEAEDNRRRPRRS